MRILGMLLEFDSLNSLIRWFIGSRDVSFLT